MARFERVVGVGQPQALRGGQVPPGLGARIEICYLTVGASGATGRFWGGLIGLAARRHGYSWLVSSSIDAARIPGSRRPKQPTISSSTSQL